MLTKLALWGLRVGLRAITLPELVNAALQTKMIATFIEIISVAKLVGFLYQ